MAGRLLGPVGYLRVSFSDRRLGGSAPGDQPPNIPDVFGRGCGLAALSPDVERAFRAIEDSDCWSGPGRSGCLEYLQEPDETSLRFRSGGTVYPVEPSVHEICPAGVRHRGRCVHFGDRDAGSAAGTLRLAWNQGACQNRLDGLELPAAVQQPSGYHAVCRGNPGRYRGNRPGWAERAGWTPSVRRHAATSREVGVA